MNEYYSEIEKDKQYSNQKKIYENMNYMSKQEKTHFESKFTKPKNKQKILVKFDVLGSPSLRVLVLT